MRTMSPAGSRQRVRRARWLILTMLALSMLLVVLGVYTATRAENLSVSGYISGVIVSRICPPHCVASSRRTAGAEAGLSFIPAVDLQLRVMTLLCCVVLRCVQLTLGSFLALLGLCLEENRHQLVSSATASSITSHSDVVSFKCNNSKHRHPRF